MPAARGPTAPPAAGATRGSDLRRMWGSERLVTLGAMIIRRVRAALQRAPRTADAVLAAGVAVLASVTGIILVAPQMTAPPPTAVIIPWAIALCAPLALRRRYPVAVLVITAVHFVFYWAVGQVNEIASWVALSVAIYSAAAYGRRPLAGWVCVTLGVVIGLATSALLLALQLATPVEVVAIIMFNALPFAVAWPLGAMMRSLRETRAELEERNRQLDEERRSSARRAIAEERVRIAPGTARRRRAPRERDRGPGRGRAPPVRAAAAAGRAGDRRRGDGQPPGDR